MYKKLLILFITIFSSFLISNKIQAANASYCQYGNNHNLLLPAIIQVDIKGYKKNDISIIVRTQSTAEYIIYNKETCVNEPTLPELDLDRYYYITDYYYINESEKIHLGKSLKGGIYHQNDVKAPEVSLLAEEIVAKTHDPYTLEDLAILGWAYDEVDGYIKTEITYDNYTSNSSKIGNYSIVYKACDKSNNCSSKILTMKVVDKIPPTISGSNTFTSNISSPLTLNDIALSLIATDNYDGNISDKIYAINHNYNPSFPGKYTAYFSVKDKSNNECKESFKVTINVKDDIPPIIEGPTEFTSTLSSVIDTKTILANLVVSDNIDNNAYKNIYLIDDTYSKNKSNPGTYKVIIGCYDNEQNESTPYIITIRVVDNVAPTIEGKEKYESYVSTPLTTSYIISNLIVLDNHDYNAISNLEILYDDYTNNKTTPGIYKITFQTKDTSSNYSNQFTVEITVYDDIAPTIEGTNFYRTLINNKINSQTLLLSLTANDNIDGDISEKIVLDTDTYSDNYNQLGTYFLSFYVCDKGGNISNIFKVKILVEDEISFLKSLDNSYIFTDTTIQLQQDEILDWLNIDKANYLNIESIENDYLTNYNIPGEYTIKYQFINLDHTSEFININIKTKQKELPPQESVKIVTVNNEKKKETIFTKIISFFRTLFANISNWFKKLFS